MTDTGKTMVEKIAEAFADLPCRDPLDPELDMLRRREAARAAIEAMREPTEGMCEAGYSAACAHDYGDLSPGLEIAPATFRAMIDAALSEGKEG